MAASFEPTNFGNTITEPATGTANGTALSALEMQYFKAVSLYRRRNYEKCTEVCNAILQSGHEHNVQMFASPPDGEDNDDGHQKYNTTAVGNHGNRYGGHLQRIGPRQVRQRQGGIHGGGNRAATVMPTWLMEGVWQLKMRALTQRVYVDDLETDESADAVNEEVEFERIATAARPGTSIKTAFLPRPRTSTLRTPGRLGTTQSVRGASGLHSSEGRMLTSSMSVRPTSGMARPGTGASRPGSSLGNRPASRCGTASRVRATSAAAFRVGDSTAALYQACRLNPTIYAERQVLVKALFQFLYYHEADVQKAFSLCEAVMEAQRQKQRRDSSCTRATASVDWWWEQQLGRCLLILHYPRKAEAYLLQSLAAFPHPDTYLLLSRLYQRLDQPARALELITTAVDRQPFNVTFRTEQGRIYDVMSKAEDSMQIYRLIARLNPINIEALACIALNYFYDNNPEMALMYYRRILSLGVHTAELYCNVALCCLYGGQIDLVLPCFQRALIMATTPEQKSDIWYNLSFVAITTGDFSLARRCLQLCLTSDARNGAALNNLAVISAHVGDFMKAKSYLNAAKEALQNSTEINSNLRYMETHYKL